MEDKDPVGALIALLLVAVGFIIIVLGFALLDRMIG